MTFTDTSSSRLCAVSFVILLFFGIPAVHAQAQTDTLQTAQAAGLDSVYTMVDQDPVLLGGVPTLWSQVRYPASAEAAGITGRVYVQFVVDAEGTVQQAEIVRGLEPGCDAEALRVVRQAAFTPGQHQGQAVNVLQTLQVRCEPNALANVGPPRIVKIQTEPDSLFTNEPIQFSAMLIGRKPLQYRWTFDDGSTDTTGGPVRVFQEPGRHWAAFTVSNEIGSAQDTLYFDVAQSDVYVVVDEMPVLIGGLASIQRQIRYPEEARRAGIQGRVIVQFIVNEQGAVQDIRIRQGIGGGCDIEAARVIRQAKFKPGKKDGKPVKIKMSMPLTFKLGSTRVKAQDRRTGKQG